MNKKNSNVVDLAKARNNKKKSIKKDAVKKSKPQIGMVNSLCSKIKNSFNNLTNSPVKKSIVKTNQPLSRKQKLAIINHIVSYYQDGNSFSKPEFIDGIHAQDQLERLDLPLVYIWQESTTSQGQLDFNCGINKNMVNVLLKSMLSPSALEFKEIQNKVINSLKITATKLIKKKSKELNKLPSEFLTIFK